MGTRTSRLTRERRGAWALVTVAALLGCGAGADGSTPDAAPPSSSSAPGMVDDCTLRSLLEPTLLGQDGCGPSGADASMDDGGTIDDDAGSEDAAVPVVIDCDPPTKGPTKHDTSLGSDETWTADASPHIVAGTIGVSGTLTIEPCAEVLLESGAALDVVAGGKLVADGMLTKPIHFGALDPKLPFVDIGANGGGTIHLAYVTIDGGGDPTNAPPDTWGMIYVQGEDPTMPSQPTLFVDHVTLRGSASNGLQIQDGAGFAPGSRDLVVTDAAQYPMSITPRALGTIPSGKYTGNAIDEILMPGGGGAAAVQDGNTTMHDRGVPYHVGNSGTRGILLVERQSGSGVATLTIERGVEIRFQPPDGIFQIETFTGPNPARGALVAVGTPDDPIVFTSTASKPSAGDWYGIWFGEVPDASDEISYARVEYAGGLSSGGSGACNTPGTNDAAIRIFGVPAGQFVKHTTIVDSAGHGIDRGWRDDFQPDFLPTNTFTRIAGCKQSQPGDKTGACPDPVPCP